MTQREMYDALQKHARANYTKGWDWVVECMEFRDFQIECEAESLDTWDKVMLRYTDEVELRNDRYMDVRAEVDYD